MDRLFKIVAVAVAVIMTVGSVVFVSCEKEQSENEHKSNESEVKTRSQGLPYFQNMQAVDDAINIATSFDTVANLLYFEKERGRFSIGAVSDAFYDTLDISKIVDMAQAIAVYKQHSDVLDTIRLDAGEIAIVPKMFYSPFRYVANADGMFMVSTFAYKIFKSCIVAAPVKYLDKLYELQEEDLNYADHTIFHFVTESNANNIDMPADCDKSWRVNNHPQTANDRIHIELETFPIGPRGKIIISTMVHVYNLHKSAGIWWPSKHTLSCNANVTFHNNTIDGSAWEDVNHLASRTQKGISMWLPICDRLCNWNGVDGWNNYFTSYSEFYHYKDYKIIASYPGHAVEALIHD